MNILNILLILLNLLNITTASSLLPRQSSIQGSFSNNCGFPVYVRQAVAHHPGPRQGYNCPGFGETGEVVINPGNKFLTSRPVYQDTCGHSIKVSRTPGGPVYQYEFTWSLEDGQLWYNLSHNDGNPFTDVARQIGGPVGSSCPYIRCQPGDQGSCDDPAAPAPCKQIGTVIGYLC